MSAEDTIDLNDARPRRWGWGLLVLGLGGFLAWALLAPLDAGVSAPGSVVVTGNRKVVQPLSGGKIAAVLARDGDTVRTGQVLVRLDDTASRSQLDVTKGQWITSVLSEARLLAERAGRASFDAPATLGADAADPRAAAALAVQRQLLATRRQALASELAAMRENQRGLELQIQGLEAARSAKETQLASLRQQLDSQRRLADEGFLPRNRVLELERGVAAAAGAVAEDTGTLGRYRQSIAELRVRMLGREQEVRKEVESQLADTQREASALRSRLEALQFDLANTEIRAPADGRVLGLAVHTVGGVVAAGSPMMEVVPGNEPLRIEAQLAPHLIDKVRPGLAVDVLFSALNQATTPHVPGRVLDVSADVLSEPRLNQQPYFKLSVEITPEGMALLKAHDIRAGMPVEVFVRTGERTAMNYLLKPLRDRLNRALTEP